MATYVPETTLGASIAYGSSTSSYTTVDNCTMIGVPDATYEAIDIAHLASSGIRDKIVTQLREPGECTFAYQYQATQYAAIAALKDGAIRYWKIELPDSNGTITFTGYLVENRSDDWAVDEVAEVQCRIVVNSALSVTVGTQGS